MAVSYIHSATKTASSISTIQTAPLLLTRIKCFQAPYGTGVLFVKGWLRMYNQRSRICKGMDLTLCEVDLSHAVCMDDIIHLWSLWMVRKKLEFYKWEPNGCVKTRRTTGFLFWTVYEYRDYSGPIHHKNIEEKYDLVPQKHGGDNQWYKIVIMDHVEVSFVLYSRFKETIHEKRNYARSIKP
jgi:hypothetical protein